MPGLRADYFRRAAGDRIATVGRYSIGGYDLLMAWGFVDEEAPPPIPAMSTPRIRS